ncbi:MAG: hypothetical protein V1806_01330 [Pseudomonadota bacterium]
MQPLFCFIDDAQFELDNFAQNAAPAFGRARFVYARTFLEARQLLAGRTPLCFLLDIYGGDPDLRNPRVLDLARLRSALGPEMPLETLYQGLDEAGDEAGNLYLRRLYGRVEGWQRAFLEAAAALGQGRAYGLHNLHEARRHYPLAACLGYSRKALFADAVAMCRAGAEGVLQKPQGAYDQAIARATREAAPSLAATAYATVDQRLARLGGELAARLAGVGQAPELVAGLAQALAALAGQGQRPPAGQALLNLAPQAAGLAPADLALWEGLGGWLRAG